MSRIQKQCLAVLVMLTVIVVFASAVSAKSKTAKYGIIKILSTPAGLPVFIDGKSYGETATDYRSIELAPGIHTVMVALPDGQRWTREVDLPAGRIKCITVNYKPGPVTVKSPCPFPVNASAPTVVNEGEIITYTADVKYSGNAPLLYTWRVSPATARVANGADTPTITVDSTGLGNQRIFATLVVDDGSGNVSCRQTTHVSTMVSAVPKREIVSRQFDTCCSCSNDDLKARLDNLVVELQNDPATTAYIFTYAGRTSPTGQADRLVQRSRDYLVLQRGVDGSRLVVANGGFREADCVEVWIVPRGATPPTAAPTVDPSEIKPAVQTRSRTRG